MWEIIERMFQQRQNKIFTPLISLLNRIENRLQEHNDPDVSGDINIAPLASDDDWVSIGMGYHSLEGNRIPQVVEKHFTFARDNIFNPSIFQHEMFPGICVHNLYQLVDTCIIILVRIANLVKLELHF